MPDIAPPTTSPSLTDLATRINSEFAAKLFRKKKGRGHWRDGHTLDTFVSAER